MCCVVEGRARLHRIRGWAGRRAPRANQVATARSSTTPSNFLQRSATPPSAADLFPRRTCTCRTYEAAPPASDDDGCVRLPAAGIRFLLSDRPFLLSCKIGPDRLFRRSDKESNSCQTRTSPLPHQ